MSDHGSQPSADDNEEDVEEVETDGEDETKDKNEAEKFRLAGRPPLKTMLILMIGPVISQITGALYGMINTVWVSHKVGEIGLSAVGLETSFEVIGRAFGFFLMVSASTQISALFGKNKQDEAAQVICDLMRVALVCGGVVPALILPLHAPLLKWFGASEETTGVGFDYILPLAAFSFFTCLNLACQGFLQAEGRTMLIGIVDLVSLGASVGGFTPLCLYAFNSGVRGAAIATILADAIPGVSLSICYFKGVFGIKPKWKQLCMPFNKNTWPALGVGASQLFSNLAMAIPGIPIRKLIADAAGTPERLDLAMAGFNVLVRYANIVNAICIAVTIGFIPPASYAHAAFNDVRYLWLSWHAVWVSFVWCAVTTTLTLSIPRQLSMIFGSGKDFLEWATPMLKIGNALGFIMFVRFVCQAMLQALQLGVRAMIVSLMGNFVGCIAFAYMLYYTGKHDVVRMMWVYGLANVLGLVFGVVLLIGPFSKVFKASKQQRLEQAEQAAKEDNCDSQADSVSDKRLPTITEEEEHIEIQNLAEV